MSKKISTLTIIICLLAILVSSCGKGSRSGSGDEQLSFCYWNTTFSVDTALWHKAGANHMYVRFFDVDWDQSSGEARPIASISVSDSIPCSYTPSIFFTNKVFEKSDKKALDSLSVRVKRRVDNLTYDIVRRSFYAQNYNYYDYNYDQREALFKDYQTNYTKYYKEILIDCDWTAGTKDNFFYFLNRLKSDFADKEITVTLRLWQYKQTKLAGVPPVKRCLLMCYNMQTANDPTIDNSIASMAELKKYISGDKYPLTLDVALPIFSWALLFRNDTFVGLLGNATPKEYDDNFIEYESLGNNRYRVLVDKVIGNYFLRKGDVVRVESVSKDELEDMAKYLKDEIPMDKYSRVTYFSWNESYIENYGTDELQKICNLFSK